jgi:hypothetical protein
MNSDERPNPSFMIMIAIVVAALVGGVTLVVVVPRPGPPPPPPPAPTIDPAVVTNGPGCAPDEDIARRLLAPPEGATTGLAPRLPVNTDAARIAQVWQLSRAAATRDLPIEANLQTCAYDVWQQGGLTVTVAALRFAEPAGADAFRAFTSRALKNLPAGWGGSAVSECCEDRQVRVDGAYQSVGLYQSDTYFAFIRVTPVDTEEANAMFWELAEQEFQVLRGR